MAKSKWEDIKEKLVLVTGWARWGLSDEQICKNLGISIQTFYNYKNEHIEFLEAIKKGKDVVDFEIENALMKKAMSGDVTAQIFWLKNRKKLEWSDTQKFEYSGKLDHTITIKEMSDEELLKLARELGVEKDESKTT